MGLIGEHQRADAAFRVMVQAENLNLTPAEIEQRFSPVSADNWVPTGYPFDFNSVTLNGFYDFNKKSLNELTQTWDESEYSLIRTSG